MKYSMLIIAFVGMLILCGCGTPPVAAEQPVVVSETRGDIPTSINDAPHGSYVLVQYASTGTLGDQAIIAKLFFNNNQVCSWDLGNTQPWDRGEELLYFAPIDGNCPGLDQRNGVIWHVQENWGEVTFNGETIQEISVWSLSDRYYLLEKK